LNGNGTNEEGILMEFRLRGAALSITPADILTAPREVRPTPIDGRNKYFVELHGRRFPIKQVLRLVIGLPGFGFGAQDAHRILSRLGFDVFEYERPTPTPPRANGNPARLPGAGARNRDNHEVLRLLVVFERDEDDWEVASCPTLPGCHSQGRTRKEALDNIREAIRGYLASLREHDAALPPSSEFQIIEVRA